MSVLPSPGIFNQPGIPLEAGVTLFEDDPGDRVTGRPSRVWMRLQRSSECPNPVHEGNPNRTSTMIYQPIEGAIIVLTKPELADAPADPTITPETQPYPIPPGHQRVITLPEGVDEAVFAIWSNPAFDLRDELPLPRDVGPDL